jgi:beta-glucanase (GH16 family)
MKRFLAIRNRIELIIGLFVLVLASCAFFKADTPSGLVFTDKKSTRAGISWHLIWSDEFDYQGLPNSAKWSYEVGKIRNNEMQYFTESRPENARIENGVLIIETRKEQYLGSDYTSASLITKNKAMWVYGRFEIRAKLPTGRGMWPAIWMLGANVSDVGWPSCGEIDIMENAGYAPDLIYANIHTEAYNHLMGNNKGASALIPQPYKDFHVYAIEWFDNRIEFFVDNHKYFTFENENGGRETWPFAEKFYLIINAAFGGSWGGKLGVDDRILPQKFYIDYVRVYRLNRL